MKRLSGLAFIVLGLLLAALSGVVVLEVTRQAAEAAEAKKAEGPEPLKKVYVVMAERDVPENVALSAEDIATREFPEAFAPAGAIAGPEYAVGKFTTARLFKGQILVGSQLSETRRSSQIAARVPEGKVAMAVAVNDAMTALGALRAGDRVDILLTVDLSKGGTSGSAGLGPAGGTAPQGQPGSLLSTQVTLQNAEILSIGAPGTEIPAGSGKAQQSPQQAPTQNSRTITFLMDHQDAIMLKFAKDSDGIMDLVVRSPEDTRLVKTEGVTFDSLYNQYHFRLPQPIK